MMGEYDAGYENCIDSMVRQMEDMQYRIDCLHAENAKLRELVADMWGFIEGTDEDCGDVTFSSCFDYCKHDTADDGCSKTGECWYEQRMRELGVDA